MEKEKKSYYQELDNALKDYEKHKILCLFWDRQDIERICNYICLYGECKYITEEQMEEHMKLKPIHQKKQRKF
ncbi:MAG: hypothetical protein KH086_00460 [Coprobacillus sp.]|nr:hypothetical protein [Coprobacillus sp.]